MTIIYSMVVTCCGHPDNEYDWIPGAVWAATWGQDETVRDSTMMISQIVPIDGDEPVRRFADGRVQGNGDGRGPYRERINESCAACGRTLVMRDDTWNELSKRIQALPGLWREKYEIKGEVVVEATLSLEMMARLAEEMRRRTGVDRREQV